MNTWPDNKKRAMHQSEHNRWNARNHPGTRQICSECGEETEKCEEDSLYAGEIGPLCESCFEGNPV